MSSTSDVDTNHKSRPHQQQEHQKLSSSSAANKDDAENNNGTNKCNDCFSTCKPLHCRRWSESVKNGESKKAEL